MSDDALLGSVSQESQLPVDAVERVLSALAAVARRRLEAGREVMIPGIGLVSSSPVRDLRFEPDTTLQSSVRSPAPGWFHDPAHARARRLARTLVADLALYRQDLVPNISTSMADALVETRCTEALGPWWREARRTFTGAVDHETRAQCDHLAEAARQRWAQDLVES